MKNWLLSLLISLLILVSHIHFWPVGTSLFVFAQLVFPDSLPAFFLGMILDFTVETIFSIPVYVVSGPRIVMVVALRLTLTLVSVLILKPVVPFVLECGNLILRFLVILGLGLAVIIDG